MIRPVLFLSAIAASLWAASAVRAEKMPLIVAHRGASHDAPENTLAAFRLAWEQGADAIEGDFFLTKDGEIVCTHDKVTGRLNAEKRKMEVAKSTLAELQSLDVGSWKGERWKGERMPTLRDVFKLVPDGKRILVEVKCGAEILPALKKEIRACELRPEQIIIISFQKDVIRAAKRSLPEIKAFWLTSFKENKETGKVEPTEKAVMKTLPELRADGLSCGDHISIKPQFLESVRGAGFETHCWTINDPKRALELASFGMQSITTDRPALIREALERDRRSKADGGETGAPKPQPGR